MPQALAEPFATTRRSPDPRADGALRVVHVAAAAVTIERSLGGMRMRIGVPMATYRDIVVAARQPRGQATLVLRHPDPDLTVDLADGDAFELARSARAWSQLTGKPITVEAATVVINDAIARRPTSAARPSASKRLKRRSSFSRRRKVGDPSRTGRSFAGEHEIIARH